ncbi:MAG: hypothetical protein KatS3mg105_5165 [Gemmatales bacterium]|nr:MAG: hypothetical protein KatS3mg105_5165 [Gemmatales bacterium]GIX00478.1 MAG: hypothetical protein KatS3mg111_3810 [Pirellulaceae bacterium]
MSFQFSVFSFQCSGRRGCDWLWTRRRRQWGLAWMPFRISLWYEKLALSAIFHKICRFSDLQLTAPIDLFRQSDDNSSNTLAAPLPDLTTGRSGDVHQGRVLFLRLSDREAHA